MKPMQVAIDATIDHMQVNKSYSSTNLQSNISAARLAAIKKTSISSEIK